MMTGPAMTLATYYVREQINDGSSVIIRPQASGDRAGSPAATEPASAVVPAAAADRVFLVAELDQSGEPAIVGAGYYVVAGQHTARLSVTVNDGFQGRGIGTQLA